MNIATIILIVVVSIIAISVGLYFWFKYKSKKPYTFILHYSNGTHKEKLKGFLVKNQENLGQLEFRFENGQTLARSSPTSWLGLEAIRDIYINELGEYAYLKGEKIDSEGYNKLSLLPEEKSIALFRYKDNANRYANPMSKLQAYILFGTFFMAFVILIGVIYSTATYINVMGTAVELQEEMNKGQDAFLQSANIMNEITKQQTQLLGALQNGDEIIRQLD